MQKDYYKILGIPPSANLQEVKTAYRSLAHRFHPDKNPGDHYAAAQFELIKEAYEVLSNPSAKEHYLQQRWYDKSINRKQNAEVLTPVTLLKQLLELERYVSRLDLHRVDDEGLFNHLMEMLSPATMEMLVKFNDIQVNQSIVSTTLRCLGPLPYEKTKMVVDRLFKLDDPPINRELENFMVKAKKNHDWSKTQPWLIAVIVALICMLIFFVSTPRN